MLFKLMKKAYELDKENKSYLYENFNDIIDILNGDDNEFSMAGMVEDIASGEHPLFVLQKISKRRNKKRIAIPVEPDPTLNISDPSDGQRVNDPFSYNSMNPHASNLSDVYVAGDLTNSFVKVASLYDPETPQQMLNLISLVEKFTNIDDDFSHDSLSVFLYPLSRGAKRVAMRPAKVVGLTKELWALSRQFDRLRNSKNDNIDAEGSIDKNAGMDLIKKDFRDRISTIKNKIAFLMENKTPENDGEKLLDAKPPIVDNEQLGARLSFKRKVESLKRQGWSSEAIRALRSSLSYNDSFYNEI